MNVGFIGFGNMAQALAAGFVRMGALRPEQIGACARDFKKLKANAESRGFRPFGSAAELAEFADMVIIAVKPHQVEQVICPVARTLARKIVVSVVSGFTFDKYERVLEFGTHHISTIPNTPVSVGEGITVCERLHNLDGTEFGYFEALFSSVGLVLHVDTAQLDIAGTVSGCGPAFVCLFTEALADAAVKHGIARADAYRMVSQMVAGTAKLQLETGVHPGILKDAVCSPGGTTIVGVAELERKGFRGAVIDAVDAIRKKKQDIS